MPADIDDRRFRKLLRDFPRQAVTILHEAYFTRLVQFSLYFTRRKVFSEEIVQDAFAEVFLNHQHIAQPREKHLYAYLVRIVRNRSIDCYRRMVRAAKNTTQVAVTLSVPSHEHDLVRSEIAAELRRIISTFPRREQECLLLELDEDLRPPEIAQRLGITRKAVNKSLSKAKKHLKDFLKEKR